MNLPNSVLRAVRMMLSTKWPIMRCTLLHYQLVSVQQQSCCTMDSHRHHTHPGPPCHCHQWLAPQAEALLMIWSHQLLLLSAHETAVILTECIDNHNYVHRSILNDTKSYLMPGLQMQTVWYGDWSVTYTHFKVHSTVPDVMEQMRAEVDRCQVTVAWSYKIIWDRMTPDVSWQLGDVSSLYCCHRQCIPKELLVVCCYCSLRSVRVTSSSNSQDISLATGYLTGHQVEVALDLGAFCGLKRYFNPEKYTI